MRRAYGCPGQTGLKLKRKALGKSRRGKQLPSVTLVRIYARLSVPDRPVLERSTEVILIRRWGVFILAGLAFAQVPQFAVEGRVTYAASYALGRWEGTNTTPYPQSCFQPTRLIRQGDEASVVGVLDLHGVRKEIRILGTLTQEGSSYRFRGAFDTKFSNWNLQRPSLIFVTVDDPVQVRLEARVVPR